MEHVADRHGGLPPCGPAVGVAVSLMVSRSVSSRTGECGQTPTRGPGERPCGRPPRCSSFVILCFSFSWGYYCLLLVPLGSSRLPRSRRRLGGATRRAPGARPPDARLLHTWLSGPLLQRGNRITSSDSAFAQWGLGHRSPDRPWGLPGCMPSPTSSLRNSRPTSGRPELERHSTPDRVSPAIRGELVREGNPEVHRDFTHLAKALDDSETRALMAS